MKDYEDVSENKQGGGGYNYHFIGSSFGKNSVPNLQDMVKSKKMSNTKESIPYKNKESKKIKLRNYNEYDQNPLL